jgi:signal transduction histidine kinase
LLEFFQKLFASDFVPHGVCMRWKTDVVWLHVISDGLIAAAYYCIPFTLIYLARKRKDLPFPWILWLFGLFIVACGTTHLMAIWTLWEPVYRLDGAIKAVTALASVPTAAILVWLVPKALAIPSPEQLRQEINERRKAEMEVRTLNSELEARVEERTRRLRRSNETLQRIAYIASHDLQEPIRMVICYNQLLERSWAGRMTPEEQEYIQFSVQGALRMQTLVNDLLELTTTLQSVRREPRMVNSRQVLDEVQQDLRLAIVEADARVEIDELPLVWGEPVQLKVVFQNLITNALKYSKKGERPQIRISAMADGNFVRFSVADKGIGIDKKYSELIFEPFKRLHGAEYPGNGIGLAICKNVVEDHGGQIWFESKVGEGTTFFFTIPSVQKVAGVDSNYQFA